MRPKWNPPYDNNDIDEIYFRSVKASKYFKMIDNRSSSSILRKTISEPQMGIEPATFLINDETL